MRALRIRPMVATVILPALALAAATGCGGDEAPASPSPTLQPTAAPSPTSTPRASATSAPTATAEPTSTPAPTPTEEPTATSDKPAGDTSGQVASDVAGFALEVLRVPVGTTVTWTNQDNSGHTVTAGSPEVPNDEFASLTLNRGDSFSHTFQSAGTFLYYCAIHPDSMRAVVTVTEK